ncbi:unnamed protein product [Durusdinium trenchii]|uniref:Uncharacterized protein n=1 Tax=Durusdinium trenchii TaxID=1381693 RepID=A0ABP0R1K6_9DINO
MVNSLAVKQETPAAVPGVPKEESHPKEEDPSPMVEDADESSAVAFEAGVIPEPSMDGVETFTVQIMDAMQTVLNKFGSTGQFLRNRFASTSDAKEFMNYLYDVAEPDVYRHCLKHPLPTVTLDKLDRSEVQCLPLAAFSFHSECSVKPDSDQTLALSLARLILKQGFCSSEEPLLCTHKGDLISSSTLCLLPPPWEVLGPLPPFSVGYVKGKARMHTLLTILAICMDNNIALNSASRACNINQVHPLSHHRGAFQSPRSLAQFQGVSAG